MRSAIIISIAATFILLFAGCAQPLPHGKGENSSVVRAFETRASNVQVRDEGVVQRILSDDRQGSRHQRFIVRLTSGQTILIQHNIDLAPRISDIKEGEAIGFFGEYIWNEQGGIVHWTHHDPAGKHVGGWVQHNGRTYQ